MSITSVVNDLVTSVSVINALKPLPPTISGYSVGGVDDTALDPAGGQTVQINGTGFLPGATITFDGSAVAVVTYVNPNQLTFTSPAKSAGTYTIYAVNSDGGTAIYIPGIIYSVLPTWTTSAGSLGSYYETTSISNTVIATGDAPITYSLFSGSLPAGSTLYANGVITGTAPVDSSSTTYSFTIQATDAQLQDSTRSFSLTINVDAVTWVSPANATTYTSAVDSAISNVALSATDAAGYNVSYSANALPTGLSLSGANISGTPTVIADSSTLLTATAATTNRTATRTINWSITVANDPYFEYNTLLIPGASTTFVDDASTNNFAVTIFGDTKPNSFNPYTPGYYSNYFDGSGDWLTIPNSTGFAFGSGAFTVEMWVYITGSSGTVTNYSNGQSSNSNFGWELYQVNTTTMQFSVFEGATQYISSSTSFKQNAWNHIACVRSSNTLTTYVNGVAGATTANVTGVSINDPASATLKLCSYGNGSSYMTGYISNFRVVKGTAVYTTTFTPSTTPLTAIANTSLLTCQSNRFIDNSASPLTITVNGNTTINSFDPFVPNTSYSTYGSGYFDGTGDYLSIPSNSALQLPTGDFTIEAWIYLTGALGSYYFIFTQTGATNATSNWDFIVNGNASGQLRFEAFSGGTQIINLIGTSSVPVNAWTHVAVTRSGSTYTIWMNGISQGTASSASTVNSNAITTYIGENNNNTYYFPGYITDVRIVKGTAVYTTTFTPPSAPLTAIANTSLLVLQNNQSVNNSVFLDNSTNNFLVTRAGNTTQGTFSPYGGNWSNYFDGTGDLLTVPASAAFAPGTGTFTVEGWYYSTAASGNQQMWAQTVGGSDYFVVMFTPATSQFRFIGNGVSAFSTAIATANTWNHFAVVRVSTSVTVYCNGVAGTPVTFADNFSNTSYVPTISGYTQSATNMLTGYLSNLRYVKGTAVYTSAFTPSTTPLTAISGTSLLTCQSPRFIDNSINNFTVTKAGDTSVQRFSPFNPSSLTPTSYSGYFDGTGDYLTAPSDAAFTLGTGDFTVECWVYPAAAYAVAPGNAIGGNYIAGGGGSDAYWVMGISATGTIYLGGRFTTLVASTGTVPLNTWTHISISRQSGTTKVFINGTVSGTSTTVMDFSATSTMYVGAVAPSAGFANWTGSISNFRVVKSVAVYTGAFTPPTTPLTATQSSGANIAAITGTSTSLLTLQSTTFIDNSTNNFTITAVGNSQPTQQNPFGYTSATTNGYTVSTIGGSGYFDGTGDYLTVPASAAFAPGTGAFTVEGWYYSTAASGNQQMWAQTVGGLDYFVVMFYPATSQFLFIGNGVNAFSTAIAKPNAWNHFAVVRVGTSVTVYCNGIAGTPVTFSDNFSNITYVPTISGYTHVASNMLTGYLSDLRYVKGTALYTSNFVPPSAPLTAVQNTSLLTNMTSAGIYDAAMMNNMETVGDAKLSTAVSKFGGSSMAFDGTGDYLKFASSQNLAMKGDFTIEMWIYPNNWTGSNVGVVSGASNSIQISSYGGFGTFGIAIQGVEWIISNASLPTTSTWSHLAITRAGTSVKLFLNGTQSGSTGTSSQSFTPITVVGFADGGTAFNGYIDDLRVTKGLARYTANFTAPASAFPIY